MTEIKIGSAMTASEAYNQNLDLLEVKSINGMVKVGDISNVSNLRSKISHLSVQPNPFSHSTNIIFLLPKDEAVSITIYDLMGKIVRQIQATYAAGEHVIEWSSNATDGNTQNNGVYYIRMDAESGSLTAKAILIK